MIGFNFKSLPAAGRLAATGFYPAEWRGFHTVAHAVPLSALGGIGAKGLCARGASASG